MDPHNRRSVLVVDLDDAERVAEAIRARGFDVTDTDSVSRATELMDGRHECLVCSQSVDRPVTTLINALAASESPIVFVYDELDAATTALDAGAAATVQRSDEAADWHPQLGATVEAVVRRGAGRAEPLLTEAVDELPDLLFIASLDGRLLRWNDRFVELTGYTDEEIAGMQPLDLFDESDTERVETTIGRIVMQGEASVVADLHTRGGDAVPHEFSGSLIEVEGEHVIVGTARDITDRLTREHELADQAERLEAVNHVNALIREVMDVLLAAASRKELTSGVCDRLTGEEGYRLAWIGSYDDRTGRVEPDVWAGEGADYLKHRGMTGDADGTVTALTAIREDRVVFAQDISTDGEATGWRTAALEYGHRAGAAIPIAYENVTYGCLCLYADRPAAFGLLEREVLSELGSILGHAIHARETKRALVTDTVTELQFKITDERSFLVQSAAYTDARLSLVGSVSQPNGSILQLYEVSGISAEAIERFAAQAPVAAEIVTERAEECIVKVTVEHQSIAHILAEVGGNIRAIEVIDGEVRTRAYVPRSVDASDVLERIRDVYSIEFLARREVDRGGLTEIDFRADVERRLTARQLDVIETAYQAGFFDQPREKTGEELASLMGISAPTFHQHLRVAERKLLDVLFDVVRHEHPTTEGVEEAVRRAATEMGYLSDSTPDE